MKKTIKTQKTKTSKIENIRKNKNNNNNNIDYYVRDLDFNKKLIVEPFKKINYNLLSTNQNWKTLYFFKKNYIPINEEYYYLNGGIYSFEIEEISNNILDNLVLNTIEFIKKIKNIVGIQIRKLSHKNKKYFKFHLWSLEFNKTEFDNLKKFVINNFSQFLVNKNNQKNQNNPNNISFKLFYPSPIKDDSTLSMVKMRNKTLYFLRFDFVLGSKVYFDKEWWEIFMLNYFKKYYKKNTNVIDIGGNIGSHTLLLSEIISPKNKIYVFEPAFADVIEKNVKANHLENNVVIFNEGCGKKNMSIEVPIFNRNCPINFGKFSLVSSYEFPAFLSDETKNKCKSEIKKINIVTLDSKNLKDISIIKIDVEGMEIDVLEGAIQTIERERPVIFLEIWKRNKAKTLKKPIFQKLLKELNYKLVFINGYFGDDYILIPS